MVFVLVFLTESRPHSCLSALSSTNMIMASPAMPMTRNFTSALPDGIGPVVLTAKHLLQLNKDQTDYFDVRTQAKIGLHYPNATSVVTSQGNI